MASSIGMLLSLAIVGVLFARGPHSHGVALLIFVLLYIISFAIGFGPVFWLMSAEVFPNRLRGTGESAATLANWLANFAVSATFLTLIAVIGATFTFWMYAFFALLTVGFVFALVPETKDKNLEQIEVYWENGRHWQQTEAVAEGRVPPPPAPQD